MYIMEHVKFSFIKTRYSFINYVSYFSNNLILLFQSSLEIASFCFRVICIICSLMWPYLFCYYASHTTDRILTIDNVAYDLNWYDCPLEVQKNLMFLIARSHQPIRIRGFKLIPCTLEGFGRVKEILSHLWWCPMLFTHINLLICRFFDRHVLTTWFSEVWLRLHFSSCVRQEPTSRISTKYNALAHAHGTRKQNEWNPIISRRLQTQTAIDRKLWWELLLKIVYFWTISIRSEFQTIQI